LVDIPSGGANSKSLLGLEKKKEKNKKLKTKV
jgi:hypothetical protein